MSKIKLYRPQCYRYGRIEINISITGVKTAIRIDRKYIISCEMSIINVKRLVISWLRSIVNMTIAQNCFEMIHVSVFPAHHILQSIKPE